MQQQITTSAIILRRTNFEESDKIVSFIAPVGCGPAGGGDIVRNIDVDPALF